MARQPEAQFRSRAMKELKALPNATWDRIEQQSIHGTPDCIGCVRGHYVAIEFKSSAKAKVTKLQEHRLKAIDAAHGITFVAYPENWTSVLAFIRLFAESGDRWAGMYAATRYPFKV